jgi:hypothetical protein
MHALGHEAAQHFDVVIVRFARIANLRASAQPGEDAELVGAKRFARKAMAEGTRCKAGRDRAG